MVMMLDVYEARLLNLLNAALTGSAAVFVCLDVFG